MENQKGLQKNVLEHNFAKITRADHGPLQRI